MSYVIKEIFLTLQGEGTNAGRPAVFCRFSRCNLWSGKEEHRATAICRFCDTDFVGTDGEQGGRYSCDELVDVIRRTWHGTAGPGGRPLVVCTGGEPLLQLDALLVAALREAGFEVAVETNGTLPVPVGVDWVCVSPKAGAELVVEEGDELKLVFPQEGAEPERFAGLAFTHRYLQPMDGPDRDENTKAAIDYCLRNPVWRLSTQTHKYLGIP